MSGGIIQDDTSLQHPVVKSPKDRNLKLNRVWGDRFASPEISISLNVLESEVLDSLLSREVGEERV